MYENKPVLIALVVVVITIAGALVFSFLGEEDENTTVVTPVDIPLPPVVTPAVEPVEMVMPAPPKAPAITITEPKSGGEAVFVLPRLDESDQLIRDGVVSLTRHEGINAWLSPDELVRKLVVFVDNIANGSIARQPAAVLAPREAFSVQPISNTVSVMAESSYRRYDQVTNILISIDSNRAVEFYILLRPLFQTAYEELGYPNAKFDDAIFSAIGRLLETPVSTQPIRLVRPVVIYEYEDPRLEALSAAQKQLVRMGPKNTRMIQAKLSELARELRSVTEE
ncbi:MAG: DUF3014 domain-containing protein [Pseudomonadales bacterium]|nr:DUF3014 domain-containing protein [Pseudomonadales bacterium]